MLEQRHRIQRRPIGRSRSWRVEKHTKHPHVDKPSQHYCEYTSFSLTASPRRAVSPETIIWQRRNRAAFQICFLPQSGMYSEDFSMSNASSPSQTTTPQTAADFFKNTSSSSSGAMTFSSSISQSTGTQTPVTPIKLKQPTLANEPNRSSAKSESIFSGIRSMFSRWLENIRSKNNSTTNVLQKNKRQLDKDKSEQQSTAGPNGTHLKHHRKCNQDCLPTYVPDGIFTSQDSGFSSNAERNSSLNTDDATEFEKLVNAVTAATAREAEIEASERRRREHSAQKRRACSPIYSTSPKSPCSCSRVSCRSTTAWIAPPVEHNRIDLGDCSSVVRNSKSICNDASRKFEVHTLNKLAFNGNSGLLPTVHTQTLPTSTIDPNRSQPSCNRCTCVNTFRHISTAPCRINRMHTVSIPARITDREGTSTRMRSLSWSPVTTTSPFQYHSSDLDQQNDVYLEKCQEFHIQMEDIQFAERLLKGERKAIFKGRWHGDVIVHCFENLTQFEVEHFRRDVMHLTMTRHDNIALFMGACFGPRDFCIVTSACKGISLYEKLHVDRCRLHRRFPLHTLRQIAHAVDYLHSRPKPIIVKYLNTRNIFLQPRVVLALTDYSSTVCNYQSDGTIPYAHETIRYLAPEILELSPITGFRKQRNEICSNGRETCFRTSKFEHTTNYIDICTRNLAVKTKRSSSCSDVTKNRSKINGLQERRVRSCPSLGESIRPQSVTRLGSEPARRPTRLYSCSCSAINVPRMRQSETFFFPEHAFCKSTDVFALGTIIFELHTRTYPWSDLDLATYWYLICRGTRDKSRANCLAKATRELMYRCWAHSASLRPSIRQIAEEILKNHVPPRRQHSDPINTYRAAVE